MALVVTHATVASDPQSPLLDHTDWNANHVVSGTPDAAGSTTQVQFNNAGALGADADFTYDSTTNTLTVAGEIVTGNIQTNTSAGGRLQTNAGSDALGWGIGGSVNGTLYGGWDLDASTANRILSTGATKTITALDTATYPSLTELAYVKGVTSSIQDQLNNRSTDGLMEAIRTNIFI